MSNIEDMISESWSNISRLFEKSSKAEQDLIKTVFDYAYRAGYNTGYARGVTDDIVSMVTLDKGLTGGESNDLANN